MASRGPTTTDSGYTTTDSGYTTTNSGYETTNFSSYDYKFRLSRLQIPAVIHRQVLLYKQTSIGGYDYKFWLWWITACRHNKFLPDLPLLSITNSGCAPVIRSVLRLVKVIFGKVFLRTRVFIMTTNSGYSPSLSYRLQIPAMVHRYHNDYKFRLWSIAIVTTTNSGYPKGRRNLSSKLVTIDFSPRQD